MSQNYENISLEDTDRVKLLKVARIPGCLCFSCVAPQRQENLQTSKRNFYLPTDIRSAYFWACDGKF